jgi:hypothetical protein
MKKIGIILVLGAVMVFYGCDDLSKEEKDIRAPLDQLKPQEPASPAAPQPEPENQLSRLSLIQTYNLIVDTRNQVVAQATKLEALKQSKNPSFYAERAKFNEWVGQRVSVLRVREEKISPESNRYQREHPAGELFLAIRSEREMMDQYIYHFQLDRPLPKSADLAVKEHLDAFQQTMKTWEFPKEKNVTPVIQR